MPTVARRKAEARKKKGHVWQLCSAALMSLIPAIVPKSPAFIVTALVAVFGVGIQAARYGYVDRPSPKVLGLILAAHALFLGLFGWFTWPRITIRPPFGVFTDFRILSMSFATPPRSRKSTLAKIS